MNKQKVLKALKPLELPLKNKEDLANVISAGSNSDDFVINVGITDDFSIPDNTDPINIQLINYKPLTIKKRWSVFYG